MKGPVRKHLSEHAVNIYSARWLMTSASQLMSGGEMDNQEKEVSENSHIYIITKIPSLSFDKDTFCYENGVVSGNVVYKIEGAQRSIPFKLEFPLLDDAVDLQLSKYPHRQFETINKNGGVVRYMPASALCMMTGMHIDNPEIHQLEVLYIGQAFGDGSRSAFERLKSHSTLQKILAEAQYNNPESEIYVLTFEYLPYRIITQMNGLTTPENDPVGDTDRFFSLLDNPLTEKQQICLIEAALIRYFQPKYNEVYKEKFPSTHHKILEGCYKLDFSGLVIEINTDELRFKLFSETVQPQYHHISNINLVGHENRWGFFHYPDRDGGATEMPNVISGS